MLPIRLNKVIERLSSVTLKTRAYLFAMGSRLSILLIASFFAMPSFAQGNVNTLSAESMLQNIANQIPSLMQLVTAISYVMGMYFIMHGIVKLKHFGESRTMMSQEHTLSQPLFFLVIGALLLYLPTSVNVGLSTFWTNPNPYGYTELQGQWAEFINVIFVIVQFIGTVMFIKGLVILSHLGQSSAGQGTWSRGITHIIGGIFCINIYQFIQVIFATLGIPLPA